MTDARAALERLDALARRFRLAGSLAAMGRAEAEAADIDRDALHRFVEQMDSDLDTPMALAGIFELVRRANAAAEAGDGASGRRLAAAVAGGAGAGTVRHAAEGPRFRRPALPRFRAWLDGRHPLATHCRRYDARFNR